MAPGSKQAVMLFQISVRDVSDKVTEILFKQVIKESIKEKEAIDLADPAFWQGSWSFQDVSR